MAQMIGICKITFLLLWCMQLCNLEVFGFRRLFWTRPTHRFHRNIDQNGGIDRQSVAHKLSMRISMPPLFATKDNKHIINDNDDEQASSAPKKKAAAKKKGDEGNTDPSEASTARRGRRKKVADTNLDGELRSSSDTAVGPVYYGMESSVAKANDMPKTAPKSSSLSPPSSDSINEKQTSNAGAVRGPKKRGKKSQEAIQEVFNLDLDVADLERTFLKMGDKVGPIYDFEKKLQSAAGNKKEAAEDVKFDEDDEEEDEDFPSSLRDDLAKLDNLLSDEELANLRAVTNRFENAEDDDIEPTPQEVLDDIDMRELLGDEMNADLVGDLFDDPPLAETDDDAEEEHEDEVNEEERAAQQQRLEAKVLDQFFTELAEDFREAGLDFSEFNSSYPDPDFDLDSTRDDPVVMNMTHEDLLMSGFYDPILRNKQLPVVPANLSQRARAIVDDMTPTQLQIAAAVGWDEDLIRAIPRSRLFSTALLNEIEERRKGVDSDLEGEDDGEDDEGHHNVAMRRVERGEETEDDVAVLEAELAREEAEILRNKQKDLVDLSELELSSQASTTSQKKKRGTLEDDDEDLDDDDEEDEDVLSAGVQVDDIDEEDVGKDLHADLEDDEDDVEDEEYEDEDYEDDEEDYDDEGDDIDDDGASDPYSDLEAMSYEDDDSSSRRSNDDDDESEETEKFDGELPEEWFDHELPPQIPRLTKAMERQSLRRSQRSYRRFMRMVKAYHNGTFTDKYFMTLEKAHAKFDRRTRKHEALKAKDPTTPDLPPWRRRPTEQDVKEYNVALFNFVEFRCKVWERPFVYDIVPEPPVQLTKAQQYLRMTYDDDRILSPQRVIVVAAISNFTGNVSLAMDIVEHIYDAIRARTNHDPRVGYQIMVLQRNFSFVEDDPKMAEINSITRDPELYPDEPLYDEEEYERRLNENAKESYALFGATSSMDKEAPLHDMIQMWCEGMNVHHLIDGLAMRKVWDGLRTDILLAPKNVAAIADQVNYALYEDQSSGQLNKRMSQYRAGTDPDPFDLFFTRGSKMVNFPPDEYSVVGGRGSFRR